MTTLFVFQCGKCNHVEIHISDSDLPPKCERCGWSVNKMEEEMLKE